MFMLFFVIPRFAVVFESLQSLPATAQALLWWARLVREHGMALGAGIAGVIVAAVLALRTARIRAAGRAALAAARCAMWPSVRVGALLSDGGVAGRRWHAGAAGAGARSACCRNGWPRGWSGPLAELRAGRAVGETLAAHGLTTPVARRLLRVGEHSGDLGGM